MSTLIDPARPPAPDPVRTAAPTRQQRRSTGLFRAFWRWHLYASFLVGPLLLVLAVTGLIYLLRFQVEPLMHAHLMRVDVPADTSSSVTYQAQLQAAQEQYPKATIVSMAEPAALDQSTRFSATLADGSTRDIYVDPWDGDVLGALNPDTTLSGTALRIHANLMAGPWGDHVLELAACWAIVMALTGYYLFVKGRRARIRLRRAKARGSRLRSLHAGIGAFVGLGLLFLLVSGLPWTDFWGSKVQQIASGQGTSMWGEDPGALSKPSSTLDESLPHSHAHEVPWAQGDVPVPSSSGNAEQEVADLDTAVTVADRAQLAHPFTVALPDGKRGVFSVIGYAFHDPSQERTVHVDRFGGQVVSTYGYQDYPLLAKVVDQGIGLHEGRSLGAVSFIGAAAMCLAVIAACVTGPLMWWRRRAGGSMGAPRGRMPLRSSKWLAGGLVVLGVVLPLFGLSLLAALLLDQLVLRRVPRLASWFNVA